MLQSRLSEPSLTKTIAVLLSHEVCTAMIHAHRCGLDRDSRAKLAALFIQIFTVQRHCPRWLDVCPSWSSPSGRYGWPALACDRCQPGPWSGLTDPTMLPCCIWSINCILEPQHAALCVTGQQVRSLRGESPAVCCAPSENRDILATSLRGRMVAAGWTCWILVCLGSIHNDRLAGTNRADRFAVLLCSG